MDKARYKNNLKQPEGTKKPKDLKDPQQFILECMYNHTFSTV